MIRCIKQKLGKQLFATAEIYTTLFNRHRSIMAQHNKKFKVLVTHAEVPQAAIDLLKENCDVTICEKIPPERNEALTKCKGMDAILWATWHKLNDEVIDAVGDNLKVISAMTSGIDYVDINAFKRRKIPLGHTPIVVSDPVADLTVALMVSAARRFHEGRLTIENGSWNTWSHKWMQGHGIQGSTVGLVGFGGIGQTIARRLQGFEIGQLIYTSRNENPKAKDFNAKYVSFDELLRTSDFVVVACPLTPETKEMFNETAFNKMKPTSIFVNVARGQIVDQTALFNALKTRKIFAAGLDVMTPEPLPKDDPLLSLPNCEIVPHLGTSTEEATEKMAIIAAQNILRGLVGEPMLSPAYQL